MSYVYVYSKASVDYYLLRHEPTKAFTKLGDAKRLAVPERAAKDWVNDEPNSWTLYAEGEPQSHEYIVGEIRKVKVTES